MLLSGMILPLFLSPPLSLCSHLLLPRLPLASLLPPSIPRLTYPVPLSFTLTCAYTCVLSLTPAPRPPSLRVISQVDWPLNIIITDSCMNKYNRLFSFLLQLKHMVWSLREVWFHLKRTGESCPPPVRTPYTHTPIRTPASALLPRRETLASFPLRLDPR